MRKNSKSLSSLPSTQQFLPIADIRDDLIVLTSGELKAVLRVSGVNFDLLSRKEQEQVLYAFQTFLNSLEFPVQILIQSRPVNLEPYLQHLQEVALHQPTEALKIETYEYISFIKQLGRLGTLMDKSFYVIVGYSPVPITPKGFLEKIRFAFFGPPKEIVLRHYRRARRKLLDRVRVVVGGLAGMGLEVAQLKTPELLELLFYCYNPGSRIKSGEALESIENLFTSLPPSYQFSSNNQLPKTYAQTQRISQQKR
ncbi:hypothetical protein J7L13_00690 [bacterium]|nr:hypothetical protein [bacterium]